MVKLLYFYTVSLRPVVFCLHVDLPAGTCMASTSTPPLLRLSFQLWDKLHATRSGKKALLDREQQEGSGGFATLHQEILWPRPRLAQHGQQHAAAKVLRGFAGASVLEVVDSDIGGTYRAVYTVKFPEAVFVLHCFQKKSKSGIATPKHDIDVIRMRLKAAEALIKELRDEKTHR